MPISEQRVISTLRITQSMAHPLNYGLDSKSYLWNVGTYNPWHILSPHKETP